jgi:16S rRNA (guanine966-N2)-methyltransferase
LSQDTNKIRIIGGKWRGRKITFPSVAGLRPTPDRIRETLFNWLAPYIDGARCLDLFAGSGALGLEALSRDALEVVALEKNPIAAKALTEHIQKLDAHNMTAIATDALLWLETRGSFFDIVFLDPPYQSHLLRPVFSLLEANDWLKVFSLIYFESHEPLQATEIPATWHLLRDKKAGRVYYYLAQKFA